MKTRLTWLLSLSFMLLLAGCGEGGPALSQVEGTVTYKGAPVDGASISFIYEDGQIANGVSGPDGKFTVGTGSRPGAPLGIAQVTISKMVSSGGTAMPTGVATADDMKKMQMQQMQQGTAATTKNELPEKYANPNTSGFTADVVSGGKEKNTFAFPLVD